MNATTITSRAAAVLVAGVAGFASYRHINDVATAAGEHTNVAAVLPLAIDGLILVATLAMLDDKRNQRRPRLSARVALVFGILATLAANVASANPDITARLVAAVPAISFLLAVEVLARIGKPAPASAVAVPAVTAVAVPAVEPAPADPWEYAETAPATPVVTTVPDAKPRATRPRAKSLTTAAKVEKAAAKMPDAKPAQIAAKAGVSETTARRYMPAPAPAVMPSATLPDAAETVPVATVNGNVPDLAEVTR